jgi:hypothetical protein
MRADINCSYLLSADANNSFTYVNTSFICNIYMLDL